MRLLRNNRGETLIEVLASVLIATLSVALLFSCILASSKMDESAQKTDADHYNALSEADAQVTPTPDSSNPVSVLTGTVTIARIAPSSDNPTPSPDVEATATVYIYGGEGMFSYRRQP